MERQYLTFEEKIKAAEAREALMTPEERLAQQLKSLEEEVAVKEGRVTEAQLANVQAIKEQIVYRANA